MKSVVALMLLFVPLLTQAQVQKCVQTDGRTVYSDSPCPNSSRESKTIVKKPTMAVASEPRRKPAQVRFSGSPDVDYVKAGALMDNIRIMGRDCEWALKVERRQILKCADFIQELGPDGQYQQVTQRLDELNRDRENAARNIDELRRITAYMKDIVRYKEFALANLSNR